MGQIAQDGETFDADWIHEKLAKLNEPTLPLGARLKLIKDEIALCESDLKGMATTMPNDSKAHACQKAYLFALQKVLDDLTAEINKGGF